MIGFLRHPLVGVIGVIAVLYTVFAYAIQPPLPRSLLIQYMIIVVIGTLLVATFDDAACRRLFAPLRALLGAPGLGLLRGVVLVLLVTGAGALAYGWAKPDVAAPVELRSVHPAPPSSLKVYGQRYDLAKLVNPLRATAPRNSEAYGKLVAEGRTLYYRNCLYCHGDNLAGRGIFATGFNPRPANFQDVGTIAQLQESYLFWRITTGGPGLPREGTPWASAMPVWHRMLTEDEVWKVITFLYDYTGHEPRSWELAAASEPAPGEAGEADGAGAAAEPTIEQVYQNRCAQCHGAEGAGDGPAADFLYPKPRDFTLAVFKYKTSHADSEFPYDRDLARTIRDGLPGTAMPAWGEVLTERQIAGLIGLIKEFGDWAGESEEDLGTKPIDLGSQVATSAQSIARGREVFKKACVQCHGEKGRGNVTSGKKLKDDWGDRIWPRNLTAPDTWRWTRNARDIFQRISAGIRGTPMPEHTTTMPAEDRWHVANYVMTLRDAAVPLARGETVLRARRVAGALPSDADDPAWDAAVPITLPLVPNVIREPRLFFSLNDRVTVRALFNDAAFALRLDVDDRTFSVPGDPEELRYRQSGIAPTPDALAVELPARIPTTSEKPWFRHGDPRHPVNIWYWRAPSVAPEAAERITLFDAAGPDKPPVPRAGPTGLTGTGRWRDGQWRLVMTRPLVTDDPRDLQIEAGRTIPIAFANWDGWAGQSGGRHTLSSWYWLLLEPEDRPMVVYGSSGATGILAGLFFGLAARRQRRRYARAANNPNS